MMPDLSSVAREAAEAEGLRRIPPQWMAFHGGTTADMMAVYRMHFIDGFTECASRLPSEREVAEAARAGSAEYLREDIPEDGLSEDQHIARAVYALIGEKISGSRE